MFIAPLARCSIRLRCKESPANSVRRVFSIIGTPTNRICVVHSSIADSRFYAALGLFGFVVISSDWIIACNVPARMNESDNIILHALRSSYGHEDGHRHIDYWERKLIVRPTNRNEKMFLRWAEEVYCDFFSLYHYMNTDRLLMAEACRWKSIWRNIPLDRQTKTHPSWAKRIAYLSEENWGHDLLSIIASDCGVHNEALVEDVLAILRIDKRNP